ncbi:site-specific integrase [Vibrio sp. D420a]|uniref:tyrosine-type recombinase/integrase n=1 Tax=Vibrio sp. D420a TaxID=2836895 RepID=UPI0025547287|nr:site-specific integrase [Vibrio sp. D420a]MDK9762970.1 site-specific integrase [Vibrio sp. D420a]
MAQLVYSDDVYTETEIEWNKDGQPVYTPKGKNLGSLPTLFNSEGKFVEVVNSYFFDLKAVKKLKDTNSNSRALLKYWSFLEETNLNWDHFPPIKRLKPTYLFRSYLLTEVQESRLSQSTANTYINHVKSFYLWAMHEGILRIENEKQAPFKIEIVQVQNTGMLAHIKPTFSVDTSDLRIRVAKDSQSKNVRPLSPLSRESLTLVASHLPKVSEEFKLQCLLAAQAGLRIQEVSTFTVKALNSATPIAESSHRYEVPIGPSTGVDTKYGKERYVEISIELLTSLQNYLISERRLKRLNKLNDNLVAIENGELILKKEKLNAFKRCERFEPFFISEQGNPVDKTVIGARWTDLRNLIRTQDLTFNHRFHDLRATYGTYRLNDLLEAGLQACEALELLMGWMGHNNESTTWKYLRYLKRKEVFKEKFALLDSIMHEVLGGIDE